MDRPPLPALVFIGMAFLGMFAFALLAPLLITQLDGLPPEQVPDKVQSLLTWSLLPMLLGGLWLTVQGLRISVVGRFPVSGMPLLRRAMDNPVRDLPARLRGLALLLTGVMLMAAWIYTALWLPEQLRLWLRD